MTSRRLQLFLMCLAGCGLAMFLPQPASADYWWPWLEWDSNNHRFAVVANELADTLSLYEKRESASVLIWSVPCPNSRRGYVDLESLTAHVTDDGTRVVVRTAFARAWTGNALTFLGAGGQVLSSYRLEDITAEHEALRSLITFSDLWPGYDGLFSFRPEQSQFAFVTKLGTVRAFDLATGRAVGLTAGLERAVRQEAVLLARKQLDSPDYDERTAGAVMVGVLGDRSSIPALKRLLNDSTAKGTVATGDSPGYPFYDVQAAAGTALATLLGRKAAPLLEAKLPGANPEMTRIWVRLLGKIGEAGRSSEVRKLSHSRGPGTRLQAIGAMLEGDDGTLVRQNPKWLADADVYTRRDAIRVLAEHARQRDVPALRAALRDKDSDCAVWALRGLVRANPPNIEVLLRRSLNSKHRGVEAEAILNLAKRGDRPALKRIVASVAALRKGIPKDAGWGFADIDDMCRVLIERKPPGTEAALRAASRNARSYIPALGALAALADQNARARVRELAREGSAQDRSRAVFWLGVCKDRESLEFLRERLYDREPLVRDAAREALKQMQ